MVPQYAVMQPANQLTFLHDEWLASPQSHFATQPACTGRRLFYVKPRVGTSLFAFDTGSSTTKPQLYAFQYIYTNLSIHLRASAGLLFVPTSFQKARMIVFFPQEQTIVLFIKVNHDISSL